MPLPIRKSSGFTEQNGTGQLVQAFCKLSLSRARHSASPIRTACSEVETRSLGVSS